MIKTFTVENFCSFERIEVRDMRRLNLLVADSGSGKTALLEAIYLAMGVSPETSASDTRLAQSRNLSAFGRATARRFALEGFVHKFDTHRAGFISFRHNVRWLLVLAPQAKECRMPHFHRRSCTRRTSLRRSETRLPGLGGKRSDSNGSALIRDSFRLSYKPRLVEIFSCLCLTNVQFLDCTRIHAFHRKSSLWPGNCAGMLLSGSCCTRPRIIRNKSPGRARRLWRT